MPLQFTSTYDLKIDAKNRLFIPTEIRKGIEKEEQGTSFFLILGPNRMPWLYPEKMYQAVLSKIPLEMSPGVELQRLMRLKFAGATSIPWDEQGRLVLPDRALKKAGIDKEVTLAGVGDHLELWNRGAWETEIDDVWSNGPDIEDKWKEFLKANKEIVNTTKASA